MQCQIHLRTAQISPFSVDSLEVAERAGAVDGAKRMAADGWIKPASGRLVHAVYCVVKVEYT
jgi:hypothetical protein